MDEAITYNEIDGLVLAVIAGDRQYDVTAWLRCADCCYRVFLSYEELRSALEKLQRGGLIVCKEKKICCTAQAKKLLRGRFIMGSISWVFRVQERIGRLPFRDVAPVSYSLSQEDYDRGAKEYMAFAKECIKKIIDKR